MAYERLFMKKILETLKGVNTIFWVLLGYIILCALFVPRFMEFYTIRNIWGQVCVLLTVACGVQFTVLNGGVDFSSTSIIALAGVIGASIMSETAGLLAGKWYAVPTAILAMFLIGLAFGLINGFSIVIFKMPSFIVTMATQMVGAGLALFYTKGRTIGVLPASFTALGTKYIGIFPYAAIFTAIIVLITHIILSRTRLGREIYAVGTNPKASQISGIPVKPTIVKLFVISGLCASCASILMIAQMESAAAGFASTMFIDIMASIIIGGTSPFGGRGRIIDTVMGAFLVILITVSMNLLGVKWFVISIIKGCIILAAANVERVRQTKARA
jgi:ribose/xylose/arabinose/galactoside ABC-type transport system permease subunit